MTGSNCESEVRDESSQWYAVHARSRHEKKIALELQEKGVHVFLPTTRQVHRWTDRRKVVDVPLFSCYVFLKTASLSEVRTRVLATPGVLKFVSVGGQAAPIPDSEINAIRAVLARDVPFTLCGFLKAGQRIRVRGGALDGIEGVLASRSNGHRLIISVALLQQSVEVLLEGYDIEAA